MVQQNIYFVNSFKKIFFKFMNMPDRLELDGFIRRVYSKEDRRKIIIERAEKDKAMQDKYLEVSEKMNEIYYNGFSDIDRDGFEKHLERILNNLQDSSR